MKPMKFNQALFSIVGIGFLMLAVSCEFHVTHRHEGPGQRPRHSGIIAEIDAAAKLTFSNERLAHLIRITRRSNFHEPEQIYLLDKSAKILSFSHDRNSLVHAVIRCPNFTEGTAAYIARNIERLGGTFSSDRSSILAAIDQRIRQLEHETEKSTFKEEEAHDHDAPTNL